jgi:hypothetical protein
MPRFEPAPPKAEAGAAKTLAGCLVVFGCFGGTVLIVLGEAFMWLKTGHWPQLTVATFLLPAVEGTPIGSWLSSPQSWYGLHDTVKILIDLPIWAWTTVVGAAAARFVASPA